MVKSVPVTTKLCKKTFELVDLPVLDPHILVDYLIREVGLHISDQFVLQYWRTKRELAREEWALQSPADESCIPLCLYGDSVQLTPNMKVFGLFLSLPLWRTFSARCSRWCIFAIEENRLWKEVTLHKVLQRVVFSINALYTGIDPETGATLAGACGSSSRS